VEKGRGKKTVKRRKGKKEGERGRGGSNKATLRGNIERVKSR